MNINIKCDLNVKYNLEEQYYDLTSSIIKLGEDLTSDGLDLRDALNKVKYFIDNTRRRIEVIESNLPYFGY